MMTERLVILDLPDWLDPIIVDVNRPLEEQLPPGRILEAAKKLVSECDA